MIETRAVPAGCLFLPTTLVSCKLHTHVWQSITSYPATGTSELTRFSRFGHVLWSLQQNENSQYPPPLTCPAQVCRVLRSLWHNAYTDNGAGPCGTAGYLLAEDRCIYMDRAEEAASTRPAYPGMGSRMAAAVRTPHLVHHTPLSKLASKCPAFTARRNRVVAVVLARGIAHPVLRCYSFHRNLKDCLPFASVCPWCCSSCTEISVLVTEISMLLAVSCDHGACTAGSRLASECRLYPKTCAVHAISAELGVHWWQT